MDDGPLLPDDMTACHQLISQLAERCDQLSSRVQSQDSLLAEQARELESKNAFVEQQSHAVIDLDASRQQLSQENQELKLTIQKLLHRLYGRRSERFVDPDQLALDFGDDAEATAEALADAVAEADAIIEEHEIQRRAKKHRAARPSQKFPAHLPRYEKVVDLPEDQKAGKKLIGYDKVETLEYIRSVLRVRVTRYAKYSDENKRVASPERPTGLVAGNRFDSSVAVEVIASRFFYHLPYYRQQDLFAGCGWVPSRSTLLNLVAAADFVLQPLVDHYRQLLSEVSVLGCDETPLTLIVPPLLPKLDESDPRSARILEALGKAQAEGRPSIKARMWAYRACELPFQIFDFTVSRNRDGPDEMLNNFRGTLMGDCWSGFQKIELRSDARIQRAACWAHARRKFDECRLNHPRACAVLLGMIKQLFDVETRAVTWTVERRAALRQQESTRVLQRIHDYLVGPELSRMLPKSDLAKAVNYVKNHWDALTLFIQDGGVPIDNNEVEQLMRQVALGRKNWMHVGSVSAGYRAANLMTLVSTAARNDLDVWVYLKDVLDRILAGSTDWHSLRADIWKQSHPEAFRDYRAEERRDAIERKRVRRAKRRKQLAKKK